ncbi:MAG: SDR family NAD(P)-dependent oxidoreductase [Clostridia bacterium]|nr:SDR family NAD(P)-dependent oxidoreductase [Clostridia bacterium]
MSKKSKIQGKTVIISGASGGIGFNVTKRLIEKYDCKIIGIARNEEKIKKAIETLGDKKSNFTYRLFDVREKENWIKFSEDLKNEGIKPDILINNAGFMLPFTKIENISFDEVDEIVKTNFTSYVYSIKSLLPLINDSEYPAVINVASAAGLFPVVGESMYCATKYAVRGLTQTLAVDYKKKIYFGGVYPGFIKTDLFDRMGVKKEEKNLVDKFTMPVDKAAKKIVKGIYKRKKNIVIGYDGKLLNFLGKFFPKTGARLVAFVLRKSKLKLFDGVFK